jgi:hypothetical protein
MLRDKGRAVTARAIDLSGFQNKVNVIESSMKAIANGVERQSGSNTSVNVFCHGWRTGVELLPRGQAGAQRVAEFFAKKDIRFLNLFACSAAGTANKALKRIETPTQLDPKGCWAQWVAEGCALLGHSIQVYGHETPGHTTWNPAVRVYWSDGKKGTVENKKLEMSEGFRNKLRDDQEYRLSLPFWLNA